LTVIIALGAAAAGFAQGLTGFAFGLIALSFWAWVLEPKIAGPLVVLCSTLGHFFSIARARRGFDLRRILPLFAGALFGVPLGVLLLVHHVDAHSFKLGVGALLAVYCTGLLFAHKIRFVANAGVLADGAAGVLAGVLGGVSGLAGVVSTLWCILRGWDRDAQRATFQSFNFALAIATLIAYAVGGVLSRELWRDFAIAGPALVVPAFLGGRLYGRFSEQAFRRLILVMLAVSGIAMLVSASTGRA